MVKIDQEERWSLTIEIILNGTVILHTTSSKSIIYCTVTPKQVILLPCNFVLFMCILKQKSYGSIYITWQ